MQTARKSFDLASADYKRDPRVTLAKIREGGDVVPIRLPFVGDTLLVVSHAGANDLLKNSKRFVQQPKNAGSKQRIGIQWWMPKTVQALADSMIGKMIRSIVVYVGWLTRRSRVVGSKACAVGWVR